MSTYGRISINSDVPEEANLDELISDSKAPEVAWNMFCVDKAPGFFYFCHFLQMNMKEHNTKHTKTQQIRTIHKHKH